MGDNTERSSLSPDWSRLIFSREVKLNEQSGVGGDDSESVGLVMKLSMNATIVGIGVGAALLGAVACDSIGMPGVATREARETEATRTAVRHLHATRDASQRHYLATREAEQPRPTRVPTPFPKARVVKTGQEITVTVNHHPTPEPTRWWEDPEVLSLAGKTPTPRGYLAPVEMELEPTPVLDPPPTPDWSDAFPTPPPTIRVWKEVPTPEPTRPEPPVRVEAPTPLPEVRVERCHAPGRERPIGDSVIWTARGEAGPGDVIYLRAPEGTEAGARLIWEGGDREEFWLHPGEPGLRVERSDTYGAAIRAPGDADWELCISSLVPRR